MTTAAADDYAYIAQRAREIASTECRSATCQTCGGVSPLDANGEGYCIKCERNMQRADEPVIGDPGDEDDALFNYYFGCVTP